MDQILLRYSHVRQPLSPRRGTLKLTSYRQYSGPAYEKRGPEDYASKDVDEIAKLGLGGKMTALNAAAAAAAADEDDDGSDDSAEERKPAKGKGKAKATTARQKSLSAAASVAKSDLSDHQESGEEVSLPSTQRPPFDR